MYGTVLINKCHLPAAPSCKKKLSVHTVMATCPDVEGTTAETDRSLQPPSFLCLGPRLRMFRKNRIRQRPFSSVSSYHQLSSDTHRATATPPPPATFLRARCCIPPYNLAVHRANEKYTSLAREHFPFLSFSLRKGKLLLWKLFEFR